MSSPQVEQQEQRLLQRSEEERVALNIVEELREEEKRLQDTVKVRRRRSQGPSVFLSEQPGHRSFGSRSGETRRKKLEQFSRQRSWCVVVW